ncbi:putative efflux protein, MATE family [Duganella sp. CF402]|uniref:MATE family efflux transporter n=1 Tax=unclassified Duganella TaxID=2636909 RepID=UPI0008B3EE58|nr:MULTISPECIES: MATE family efflux transporter [unclassified Duganella]RZT10373.1 putative MATE family efflux protein [Duganella sp. BK701]SEL15936.1 putative efflux protein, MATE family [Duganella sp. CF402]
MPAAKTPIRTPPMFNLAWPLLVELGLAIASSVVGTALASRISDAAGGAFAIASQVSAALFILFRIIGAGVSVVVTQNLGGGQREAANKVACAVVGASTWLGAVTGLIAMLGANGLLHLLNTPAEVFPLAAPFLVALGPAMLFDAWNASMAGVMRAHLRTRDTLVVLVIMHVSHLLMALPLIYGWGPLPALGLPGYAVALAVSRMIGLALHLLMWRVHLHIEVRRDDWWRLPRRELAAVLHIGLPGAAENIAWRLAFMVSVATAAELGAKALATQAYVLQLMGGVMMFSIATGLAVEIVVGYLIGAGQLREAHRVVKRALGRGLVVCLLIAALAAVCGRWLLGWFTQDAEILAAGATLLWITVVLEPGRTFNLVVINALRAAGDARFPVMAGAFSMLFVLAGGSWLLGVVLGWGLPGVWIAYAADEWIRGLIMWRRWQTHAWVPHARVSRKRLRPAIVVEG